MYGAPLWTGVGSLSCSTRGEFSLCDLRERGAVVYGDGKPAIIALEKGAPGERAFAAWGQ